jgi:glycosyltransferase involved in cell wall biosynthesis
VLVAGSLDAAEPVLESLEMARLAPEVLFRVTGDAARLPAGAAVPPNVVATGFLPYPQFLGAVLAADLVTVFTTDPHQMSRAAFEAVGLGRPLLLSDTPGLRSRFEAAAAFTANRPAAMAAAVRKALDCRQELAARSERLAEELKRQRDAAMRRLRGLLDAPPAPPPRVLLLTQHYFPGNPVVERAVTELLRNGVELDLVCLASPRSRDREDWPPELRVYRLPIQHRRRPLARYPFEYAVFFLTALVVVSWLGLRRRYAAVQVDNLPDSLVFAAQLPRRRGARLVFNMYELTPEMAGARFRGRLSRAAVRLARWMERRAVRCADHVIVVSQPCFDALCARGIAPDRMSVVLNTSSVAVAPRVRKPRMEAPVLVTHGTLVERYGVDVVVRAMAVLRPLCPELRLQVIGDGEQLLPLTRLAERLGLSDRVTFTGQLPWSQTLEEVRRATLGLVAVLPDGYGQLMLPIKLLEYARCGVPAVCSRLPAIEAYFRGDAVAYFRPGDEQELAAQVQRLLRDPEAAERQAALAAQTAARLAWEHVRLDYLRALGLPASEGERGA